MGGDVASECGVTFSRGVSESRVVSPDLASGAIDLRGVRRPRPPGTCLRNVSSVVGDMCIPTGDPPAIFFLRHTLC